jgi:hypothetical protein
MTMPNNRTEHDAKVRELKDRFEREGYEVVLVEPGRSALPFDLEGYVPDLIARKDGGGLIVEVKSTTTRTSIERFQSIAQNISQHKGWRFVLVTVDDLNIPAVLMDTIGWDDLDKKLAMVRPLLESGHVEPAILYVWSIFESMMRKLAITVAMPVERLPATRLMNQLYTAGYMSVIDFTMAKKFLAMRNGITHGYGIPPDVTLLNKFLEFAGHRLDQWRKARVDDGYPTQR